MRKRLDEKLKPDYAMKFTVKNGVMTKTGGFKLVTIFRQSYPKYFYDLAPYLPDMEFVVNVYD